MFARQRQWWDAGTLGVCALVSQLFWKRATRGGTLHVVDGIIAKATIARFITKTSLTKRSQRAAAMWLPNRSGYSDYSDSLFRLGK